MRYWRYLKRDAVRNWDLYLMAVPMVVYYIIFCYGPMYGLQIAFMDYNPWRGMAGSKFVGFKHFINFLSLPSSFQYIGNTLRISISSLIFSYPLPIILALMFNAMPSQRIRKTVQTVFYMPHFVSTVVVVGMLALFTNNQVGAINQIIRALGGEAIDFNKASSFLPTYLISGIWQGAGWSTIIYTGALTSVNPELYEAATVDGASKFQRVWHIDIPSILPTMSITLILAIGGLMSVGHEKVYLMQSATNISVTEIVSTYSYKAGLISGQYSYSSAIGMFNSVVNFILLLFANTLSRRVSGSGIL
ncbi:MAG: ABC transporter permease subunit [Bacillota bacterium]|nr:ABC transporter permease subunit [Bacillota bacterium]